MNNKHLILPVYIILLLVMFILPYFSAEGYSILSNTTSQLGAQNTPNAWIMNITFGLLGLACIWEAIRYLKHYWFQKILLIIFGVGLIFTAIFQHAPITEGVPYNLLEDQIHSVSASIVGFSFTLFSFSVAFIEKTNRRRIIALFMGLLATGLSLLMFSVTDLAGVWQRLMFTASFAWIIFFFACEKRTKSQLP
jgi:hypothetical membrane protein